MKATLPVFLALAAASTVAAAERPLTLADAVDAALRGSPYVGAAAAGRERAEAAATRAAAMRLPAVSLRESYTRGDDPTFVFGSLLEQGRFGAANFDPAFLNDPPPLANWRSTLSLRYPLFDQFQRADAIGQARRAVEQSEHVSELTRQEVRLAVLRGYFGLAVARERSSVAAEAVKSAQSALATVRARFDAGLVAESDLLAAGVQLAEFRQQQIESEGDAAIAAAALNQLLRRPLSDEPQLATELSDRPFAARSLDELLQQGRAARPEIHAARLNSEIAALELRTARGAWLPRLDAFADLGASGRSISEHNGDRVAGLTFTWNVLDPSRAGRVAEASAAAKAAGDAGQIAADAVDLEIVSAYHRTRAAADKLETARRSVDQAESAARIVRDRYEQGLTTITEALRAETALLRARLSLLAARHDTYLAQADLLRSIGGLHDVQPFL